MEPDGIFREETVHSASAFRLLDDKGVLRAELSVRNGEPVLALFDTCQRERINIKVSGEGHPQLQLWNLDCPEPVLRIEGDAFGGHVMLAGLDAQQTYLFMRATGATGLVMIDAAGERRAQWTVSPDGVTTLNFGGALKATACGQDTGSQALNSLGVGSS